MVSTSHIAPRTASRRGKRLRKAEGYKIIWEHRGRNLEETRRYLKCDPRLKGIQEEINAEPKSVELMYVDEQQIIR